MHIPVEQLTGLPLNWAVAVSENHEPLIVTIGQQIQALDNFRLPGGGRPDERKLIEAITRLKPKLFLNPERTVTLPSYDSDCEHSQPILERDHISTIHDGTRWVACTYAYQRLVQGPTQLIAGMRCRVALKFGDAVDVPACLIETPAQASAALLRLQRQSKQVLATV